MKLTFRLRFHTSYGQSLWLSGNPPRLGQDRVEQAVALQYLDAEFWQAIVDFSDDLKSAPGFSYHYLLRETDGSLTWDAGNQFVLPDAAFLKPETLIVDSWNQCFRM